MTAPLHVTTREIHAAALDLVRSALDVRVTASVGDLAEARALTRRVAHIAARLDDLLTRTLPRVPRTESDAPTVPAVESHGPSGVHRPTRQAPPVLIGLRHTDSQEAEVKRPRLSGRRAPMTTGERFPAVCEEHPASVSCDTEGDR